MFRGQFAGQIPEQVSGQVLGRFREGSGARPEAGSGAGSGADSGAGSGADSGAASGADSGAGSGHSLCVGLVGVTYYKMVKLDMWPCIPAPMPCARTARFMRLVCLCYLWCGSVSQWQGT